MANYFARKAGNINATDVWATTPTGTAGAQTFVAGDVLHSNNFAITVNVTTDLDSTGEVRNDNANSATAGGSFTLSNGVTLTANVVAGSTTCVSFAGTSGNSATLVGNVTNTSANGAARNTSTGTLNITGNVTGGSAQNAIGAYNISTGTLNITGNVTAGSNAGTFGAYCLVGGTLNITGNVTGGSQSSANGVSNEGTTTITGNCTGGSVAGALGASNASTTTLTIVGSAVASSTAIGASNASTGTLIVTRAVGNSWGIGAAGGVASNVGLASAAVGSDTRAQELEYGTNGQSPTSGAVKIVGGTNNKALVTLTTSVVKTLADPSDGTGQANEADVRSGTSYALGNKTGTCAVPAAGSVALGVAVGAGFGTAVLTPAAIWDAATSSITASNSIGVRLKNAATVEAVGQALADVAGAV